MRYQELHEIIGAIQNLQRRLMFDFGVNSNDAVKEIVLTDEAFEDLKSEWKYAFDLYSCDSCLKDSFTILGVKITKGTE